MPLEIRLLGRFAVLRDGEEVPAAAFRGRLVRTLVRILVTRRGSFVSRDVLAEYLWRDGGPADPDLNLNVLVTRARHALGDPSFILTSSGGYSFTGGDGCVVDAEEFREEVASGRGLETLAAALRRWGEPLAEDMYEDWAQEYRSELLEAYQGALEQAAATALALGEAGRAVGWARTAVARDPMREAAHLLLARALAASRDAPAALGVLAGLRMRLAEELGIDPSPEAAELEMALLRGEPVVLAANKAAALGPAAFDGLVFVGRDRELAAVLEATGPPGWGVGVVAGASGSGKTRLLAEVTRRAPAPVFSVRAAASERDEPWHVARGLLGAVLAVRPQTAAAIPRAAGQALGGLVPELAERFGPVTGPLDVESRRALLLEGGVRLLEAAAGDGCLVVVDDLQWADASSLALLERATGRTPRLGLIVAFRVDEVPAGGPAERFVADLASGGVRVQLGPLAAEGVARAIADPGLVEAVMQETDASPIAITQVVRELADSGVLHREADGRWAAASHDAEALTRDAARRGQRRNIEFAVERQGTVRREVLGVLGVLGRETPARLVAAATRTSQPEALDNLEALGRAGLVRAGAQGWTAAHDLIAEVVVAGLGPPSRARLHEVLAEALAAEEADPAEVARHLAGAGDTARAAEAFGQAAVQRLDRFANPEAEQVAGDGLALNPRPAVRSSLLEVRAEARARTGNLAGAREDLRGALAGLPSGTRRAHLLSRMALLASGAEDLLRAAELVELALAEAGRDDGARAEALSVAAIIEMNADRQDEARQHADEALELFRQTGNARGIADVLDGRAMATFLAGDIRGAVGAFDRVARLFTDSGDLLRAGTPRSTRGHALTFMALPAEGLVNAEEALELARTLGHSEGEAYALWHCSEALSGLGRPEEALEAAGAALAIAERIDHREWTAASLRAVGIALQAKGDLAGAEVAFRRSLGASENLSLFAGWACARVAMVLMARGDLAAASAFASAAASQGPGLSRYEGRLAAAEVAVARGDAGAAEVVAQAQRLAEAGGHLVGVERLAKLTP